MAAVAAICAVLLMAACTAVPAAAAAPVYSQRLMVGLAAGVSADRGAAAVEHAGGRGVRRVGRVGGVVVEGRHGLAADLLRRRLLSAGVARYVEPDFLVSTSDEPTN